MLKVHIVSETPYVMKGQGVHTAFVEHVELLKEKTDIEVVVNTEGKGNVFHCHTYGPYYFWKGRKYQGRRIHTAHVIPDSIKGSLPWSKQLFPFVKWYFKKVFSYADVVIALSPMVEQAIRDLGVKTRIISIHNPVLPDFWKGTEEKKRQGRKILNITGNEPVVLGVGQLQSRKGVEDFIDVAASLAEARFIWVGGRPFGAMTEGIGRINKRIKNAPSNVYFAGPVDLEDMPNIYAAADILLFPSYQENCPLVPIEAAASGIPVIFRDIKEYEQLYKAPYLKGKNNINFINLITKLIREPDFYITGKHISEKLIQQFDKNLIRSQFVQLYHEVVHDFVASSLPHNTPALSIEISEGNGIAAQS